MHTTEQYRAARQRGAAPDGAGSGTDAGIEQAAGTVGVEPAPVRSCGRGQRGGSAPRRQCLSPSRPTRTYPSGRLSELQNPEGAALGPRRTAGSAAPSLERRSHLDLHLQIVRRLSSRLFGSLFPLQLRSARASCRLLCLAIAPNNHDFDMQSLEGVTLPRTVAVRRPQ